MFLPNVDSKKSHTASHPIRRHSYTGLYNKRPKFLQFNSSQVHLLNVRLILYLIGLQ
jgi:Ulp1 family protease